MEIHNPLVHGELEAGRPLRLNLGGGKRILPGYFNVDLVSLPGVDIQADLNDPLTDLPNDCVDDIYTRHTLEHVVKFPELLAELHRICRHDARLEVIVPHFSNPYYFSDPTHVRFFGLYSFFYYCDEADQPRRKVPNFYSPVRFKVESVRFNLMKESIMDRIFRTLLQPLANWGIGWLDWYERRMCRMLPVSDVHYVLRNKKAAANAVPIRRAA